jgi:tricarboxylate carrier
VALVQARALLHRHAQGEATGATDAELWDAKRLKDAIIHPVTDEKMFLPGRMSAFVPVNTIPTVGMLLAHTPAQNIFWQWVNQSLNVMCNYVNRSGAAVDTTQILGAYGLAVGVSCSIAVGASKLIAAGPPWVKRLRIAVPYAAVVTAGAANVAFTRMPEMQDGVPITAPDGSPLGTSRAAARSAVVNTILSRILLQPIAPMLLPPLMFAALRSRVPLGTVGAIVAQTGFVATCSGCALPLAIAFFPQEMKIATSALEPEFQHAKDATGKPIEYVLCNKGL